MYNSNNLIAFDVGMPCNVTISQSVSVSPIIHARLINLFSCMDNIIDYGRRSLYFTQTVNITIDVRRVAFWKHTFPDTRRINVSDYVYRRGHCGSPVSDIFTSQGFVKG